MHGTSVSGDNTNLQKHLYQHSRQILEKLDKDDMPDHVARIESVQAWTLVAIYEFKQILFSRAWMSTSRASRLAQMPGLHHIDAGEVGDTSIGMLPLTQDYAEIEERLTGFLGRIPSRSLLKHWNWLGYGIGEERRKVPLYHSRETAIPCGRLAMLRSLLLCLQIATNLPSPDEYHPFHSGGTGIPFREGMEVSKLELLSPFARVVFMADLCTQVIEHTGRVEDGPSDSVIVHEYWLEHYHYDKLLAGIAPLSQLPSKDPNSIFATVSGQCAAIYLHQDAIERARKSGGMKVVIANSEEKCLRAAVEVASTMRQVDQMNLSAVSSLVPRIYDRAS